ncbi:unnamed protein product [Chondrus crispus]|uniref:Fanconi anemia group D2 protein n=1 Tax=Chondrus crispus TaxID=2769 RepID=S0F2X8_CHOCR|nr:unnamed protein product [Chondrus crispus]CDF77490.1 unnamed protein product [Chondrus crispus]|eukprot:XP_005712529.1 unnamed protein product [Chondrus crispus]
MVTCIVNKISEFGEESNAENNIATILLNQLRWLDFIVDGPALCESLLSIVPIVSYSVQRALIEALPEILDDSSREVAVTEMIRILEESPSLMGSVVDAIGALGVNDARLPDVNASILSTLNAANRDMLPVSLKYLLRTCPPSLLSSTVSALRHTLAMPSLGPGPGRLSLDAVKSGLRMKKQIADQVLKVLRGIDKPSDHKPSDFWLIIALFDSPMHRKPAEILFRKKAAKAVFSKALIDAALAPFADAFGGLTHRLLYIAGIALKSSELGARSTGITLYALVFQLFPDGNVRRNIVMALLDHTGTRKAQEVDAALEALVVIARENETNRALLPHSAVIQGLLDFLEFFSDSQLRSIWTILGYLCRASSAKVIHESSSRGGERKKKTNSQQQKDAIMHAEEENCAGESELAMLEILLRKELTHVDTFYRRIGVLGACTMIKVLGNSVENNILSMMLDIGRSHPLSQALAFDELARVFSDGTPTSKDTAEFIRKTVSNVFEKKYIRDRDTLENLPTVNEVLPAELFGNLEGDDVEFCFSIAALARTGETLKDSQDAVRAMVPNLRLLCVMTASRYEGSLSEIDATIGAPLHMAVVPSEQSIANLPTRAKGDLLLSLFTAHGWVVELLNGFSDQESTEMKAKCIKRVDDLLTLSNQISLCVTHIPLWKEVIFDSYSGSRCGPAQQRKDEFRRKAGKGSTGSRVLRESRELGAKGQEWLPFARQLDATALSLIRVTSPVSWRFTEVESECGKEGNPVTESVRLSSRGLLHLLSELAVHIEKIVGGEFRDPNAIGVVLFRSSNSAAKNVEMGGSSAEASTSFRLKNFTALQTPLTALPSQIRRCLDKILPNGNDSAESDSTIEVNRKSIELCLRCLAEALNSKAVADPAAAEFLFTVLGSIRLDGSPPVEPSDPLTSEDIHIAAREAFGQLRVMLREIMAVDENQEDDDEQRGCADAIGFVACCSILGVLDSVYGHCSEMDQKRLGPQFSESAISVISHRWDIASLRSRRTQKLIPGIVKIYVQTSTDPFRTAEDLRLKVVSMTERQATLQNKPLETQNADGSSQRGASVLGTLTEQTVNAFTIAILEQYIWLFKSFRPRSFEDPEDAFQKMAEFMRTELPLYTLARQNQRMLGPVMRAGRTFVELFLKSCLPFLKENFKEHRSAVVQICKAHQKPTRVLQTFCAHSKFTRDSSLTGLVPPLRKSLELLLYRVKDLMQSHNATDAFQLGNLKHRDINGDVLNSQHLQYKSESENESEYSSDESDGDNMDQPIAHLPRLGNDSERKQKKPLGKSTGRLSRRNNSKIRKGQAEAKGQKRRSAEIGTQHLRGENEISATRAEAAIGTEHVALNDDEVAEDQVSRTQPKRRKKRRITYESDDERPRNPLIDDEAGYGSGDEDDNDIGDLSQFIVFGDEEEEE